MFRLMRLNPPHGWNAVGWELAIVTLGVLVALGAQQMVESWSWDRKVAAAEETMREEIRNSLIAAVELDRLKKCTTVQLDELQDALIGGDQDRARRIIGSRSVFGVGRLWADNAFEATLAAQVSDHLGAAKLKSYSETYQLIRKLREEQNIKQAPSPELSVLFVAPDVPNSPERQYAQLREVAVMRLQLLSMQYGAEGLARYAKRELGLAVTEREYLAAKGRADIIRECETAAAEVKS